MPSEFQRVLTEAVADFATNGYDSEVRLADWVARLRAAAEAEAVSELEFEEELRRSLGAIYARLVDRGGLTARAPGVGRFTIERVRPELRSELDRRITASAELIRLNRRDTIDRTLQRFSGWATSVPSGGGRVNRREVKYDVSRPLSGLGFKARRVAIDQSHKLMANISEITAVSGGALAGRWTRHYTRFPRKEHIAIDGKVFTVRDNWALQQGLMKVGDAGYTDEIERPGFLPLCRCSYIWLMHLRQLPDDMLTEKGRDALARARREAA